MDDSNQRGVAFANCPQQYLCRGGGGAQHDAAVHLRWLEATEALQCGAVFICAACPYFPDDAKAGVPFASKARQGSQVTFLMFDGSLQFLFTHFKITEGDHLFPSW